jgi:desulfoferrodoxin (superoxide reductase-like protein)
MIRTLKAKIYKYLASKQSKIYVDVLPSIVNGINHSITRTHKMKPIEVTKKNEAMIFKRLYPNYGKNKRVKFMFDVGDSVRFSKFRSPFHKAYHGNWSDNVYLISQRIPRSPPVYKLTDKEGQEISGTFYGPELIKAGLEKKDVKKEDKHL